MRKFNKSFMQIGWFVGTIAASAAIMLAFYPYWLIVMILAVLITHELGHYGAAKLLNTKAALPIFFPLGPVALGATYIPTQDKDKIKVIAMMGPLAGLTVSLSMLIAFILLGSNLGMIFASGMAARELFAATLGGDARKFRKAKEGSVSNYSVLSVSVPLNYHADWSITQ